MAEFNLFTNNLQRELTCSICDEIFTNPRTLKCHHSFCLDCISSWNDTCKRQSRPLTCPSCRSIETLEGNEITSLPSAFFLDPLIQLLCDVRTTSGTQSQQDLQECVSCKKEAQLLAFCPQCEGQICTACVNAHQTYTTFVEQHHLTFFTDFKKEDVNSYIKSRMYCKEKYHDNKKLDFYCTTCKRCICLTCNATEHKPHRTVTVEQAAAEVKVSIRQDLNRASKVKENYERELEFSKENMNLIEKETEAAINQVKDEVEQHISVLREHQRAMIETLKRKLEKQKKKNDEEQKEILDDIERISEFNLRGQTLIDENVAIFIIKNQQEISQQCETFLERTSVLPTKPSVRNASVRYKPNPKVTQCLQDIGVLVENVTDPSCCCIESLNDSRCSFLNRFEVVTRNSQNELCITNQSSIDVQIQDDDGNNVDGEVNQIETGIYIVKYVAEKPCDHTIHVRINGKEIKNSPQTVKAHGFGGDFKPVKTFGENESEREHFLYPTSIAVSKKEEIAIVDRGNRQIVIFSVDGEYSRRFGEMGTGKGQLMNPFGVFFNEDRILVTDNNDSGGSLQEFDLNGDYCRTIYEDALELRGLCTTDENIAVCFEDPIYLQSGVNLFNKQSGQIVQQIADTDGFEAPWYVAYDNGRYFVSYPDGHHIRVFDRKGEMLYKFGKKGKRNGQFNFPRDLCVISGAVLVCDMDNHRVQMLTLDGRFISSFGKQGSRLGQMSKPYCIEVTPYGQVFVCELGNGRVHVWR